MIVLNITATGSAAGLQRLSRALANLSQVNARIAVDTLELTQTYVAGIPDHATANRLGAKPTQHLEKVANRIESRSNATRSTLLIPRASRLRAAFGAYQVVPGPGKKFLTLPVAAEAYGRRARTFGKKLVFMRVGPRKQAVLARKPVGVKGDTPLVILYLLVKKVRIPEDRSLIPFDAIQEQAGETIEVYVEEIMNQEETA